MSKTPAMVLQEYMIRKGGIPMFDFLERASVTDIFRCKATADDCRALGEGRTKKEAKQNAARLLLQALRSDGKFFPSSDDSFVCKPDAPVEQCPANAANFVGKLSDLCAEYSIAPPVYVCLSETGPPHSKRFTVQCSAASLERVAAASTKKAARQMAAAKVLDYFQANAPDHVAEFERNSALAESDAAAVGRMNEIALSKFSTLDAVWKPNLGQVIDNYHLAFRLSLDDEKYKMIKGQLERDDEDVLIVEDAFKCLELELMWSSVPARHGAVVSAAVPHAGPPICIMAWGTDFDSARRAAAAEMVDYLRCMLAHARPSQSPRKPRRRREATGIVASVRTHASKTESPRQEGPVVRVSERASALSAKRRWVPPSTLRHQDALAFESENDPIFRKVRGLLNKLTPEKFQKLSDDLLNIGLDTELIIRGVIILIFDKALDEPNYSSMYAQLCKRLADVVPNFEKAGEKTTNTFCILLLNKCRTEFENRSAVANTYDQNGGALSAEDEERRHIAKSKMLGNIKFIGELAKLEILPESIVRKCILQLLEKSRQAIDQQDLECLAQLFRTCGRILDSEKARGLMDQYFERMEILSKCDKLTPRIRFMLRDLIDLRKNGWVPRKAAVAEGPVPIQQLRGDDDSRSGYGGRGGGADRLRQQSHGGGPGDSLFRHNLKTRGGLDDIFSNASFNSSSDILNLPSHDKYSFSSNGYGRNEGRDGFRGRNQGGGGGGGGGYNNFNQRQQGVGFGKHQNNNVNSKDVAPRFKKSMPLPSAVVDLQMRPSANSLLYKANNLKPQSLPLQTQSGGIKNNNGDFLSGPPKSSAANMPPSGPGALMKENAITIKQAQDKASKAKKDKGPNREEILKRVTAILDDLTKEEEPQEEQSEEEKEKPTDDKITDAVAAYNDIKVPDKVIKDVPFAVLNYALEKTDAQAEKCISFLVALKKGSLLTTAVCNEGFKSLAAIISQREASTPRIGTAVAQLLTNSIQQGLTTLAEIGALTENGAHYPLILLVLQQLHKNLGKQPLTEMYNNSKINLMSLLPASERTKDRLAEILEERNLSFLFPLLRIQAELAKQLQADPNPTQFYKWIKENLDVQYHSDPGFINALVTVLIKYITQESSVAPGVVVANPPDKALTITEKEKSLLERYSLVLRSFLHKNLQLQLMALHSLQVYCNSLGFPKGMLLKWFMALYDVEICEEDAFFMWKEDITDAYPGKGNALFQVNSWLVWLQNAESDSDETDE